MPYYFRLQYLRICRRIEEAGLPPLIGLVLACVIFIIGSAYLFQKTSYAVWIYTAVAISVLVQGTGEKDELLRLIFSQSDVARIRVVENALITLPFSLWLVWERAFWYAAGIQLAALMYSLLPLRRRMQVRIPTPFGKYPFEFIRGFRATYWLIAFGYFLMFKAVQVDNMQLGFVSLGLLFLICMSYYFKPENSYFVWIYATSSRAFLRQKISTALLYTSFITLPILVALCIFYTPYWYVAVLVQVVGYVFIVSVIPAKYSAYPGEMRVPQALLYGLSLWFPPMLLLVIPLFYKQSLKRLQAILEW